MEQCSEYGQSNAVNTVRVKSKQTGQNDGARSLRHSALGYQSLSERVVADTSIKLNSFQFIK